jgi:antitoxin component YwqK of YwqJK toxin-antitoxin module
MADESCIHCGQPSEDGDRVTESGRVHERCWDAFSEEKPVAKSSVVAGIFGLSMVAGGATLLSIGLAVLAMVASLDSANIQNPLVGIPAAIMWIIGMGVVFLAISAGAIMLSIAFLTWVATNNNAFKNYVAGGVAIVGLSVFVVGPELMSWVHSYEKSKPSSNNKEPNFITECKPTNSGTLHGALYRNQLHCRGPATGWDNDGQKRSEIHYADPAFTKSPVWNIAQCIPNQPTSFGQEFLCDVREGKETHWYANGQLNYEVSWVNNRKAGTETVWHANGQKGRETVYLDGKEQGLSRSWHENGQKKTECNYQMSGLCIAWYDNGQKKSECNRAHGKVVGVQTNWYENGQKSQEIDWGDLGDTMVLTHWNETGGKDSNQVYRVRTCNPNLWR